MSKKNKRQRFAKFKIENADDTLRVVKMEGRVNMSLEFNQEYDNPYSFEFNSDRDALKLAKKIIKEVAKRTPPF